ncbi:MAG: glycogen synthase GlgA [Chitinispirillaceae bacterium]|nr:glycogen synthase GlgA [Chitinispirillaceae bacterium]
MQAHESRKKQSGLNILVVASELYPYAKIGGLADVVASLSAQLHASGHDVRIVIPRYHRIDGEAYSLHPCLEPMGVWMGDTEEWCSVHITTGDDGVPVYFIEHHLYFSRDGLYHDQAMHDFDDNPRRFGFLSRAALQLCKDIDFEPDIVHVHDWQAALAPAYLKLWHWNDRQLGQAASVLTIHNIAYQGVYPKEHLPYLGLGWHNFTPEKFESFDRINFLKGGIYYADGVTTVSPSFARETTTPFGGFGLAPYLSARGPCFKGILNGIDYSLWNPQTDQHLPAHYSLEQPENKKACKRKVQELFDVQQDEQVALIGVVGRFVEQKGFELLARTLERILGNMIVQFVILGTGERHLEQYYGDLPKRYSGRVGSFVGFDNMRSHLIQAGCDFFLMPSLFEPCGLTQMYAQRYGTLPIVRATGGLEDTVEQYNESTGEGTGFKFWEVSEDALYYTVGWAISTYYDRKEHISRMMREAMKRDFSWQHQAHEYEATYYQAIANKKKWDESHTSYYW